MKWLAGDIAYLYMTTVKSHLDPPALQDSCCFLMVDAQEAAQVLLPSFRG